MRMFWTSRSLVCLHLKVLTIKKYSSLVVYDEEHQTLDCSNSQQSWACCKCLSLSISVVCGPPCPCSCSCSWPLLVPWSPVSCQRYIWPFHNNCHWNPNWFYKTSSASVLQLQCLGCGIQNLWNLCSASETKSNMKIFKRVSNNYCSIAKAYW